MSAASRQQTKVRMADAIVKREGILLQLARIANTHTEPSVRLTATELGNALSASIDLKITGKRQQLWMDFMAKVNQFIKDHA
jgi:hypothetical protein